MVLSRTRALLCAGAQVNEILMPIREWAHQAPRSGRSVASPEVLLWSEKLTSIMTDAMSTGASLTGLLSQAQILVRREERLWVKAKSTERQLAFQGAIAIVLPWAVAAITDGLKFSPFLAAGLICQLLGLAVFYLLVRRALRHVRDERYWLSSLVLGLWMRLLAGQNPVEALERALEDCRPATAEKKGIERSCFRAWERWLVVMKANAFSEIAFQWRDRSDPLPLSEEFSQLLARLIRGGAPAAEVLREYIDQLEETRQSAFEERLAVLPVRLALVFCLFLAPAVFLILMGAIWPSISGLLM